jgi:hypothetical protein
MDKEGGKEVYYTSNETENDIKASKHQRHGWGIMRKIQRKVSVKKGVSTSKKRSVLEYMGF